MRELIDIHEKREIGRICFQSESGGGDWSGGGIVAWASGAAALICAGAMLGCGGGSSGPANNCTDFAGSYSVTTEIVETACPVGLHVVSEPVTWTFVQTAPSCSFTMTNSLYAGSQYSGYLTMEGSDAKVTWTTVTPAPTVSGHSLTYTAEDLTLIPAVAPATAMLSGSFSWSSSYGCTGTTDVCHGSIPAGCLTPN